MFESLEQLEQLIRPLETAEYLGYTVRRRNDCYVMDCPYCGADLWIQSNSYLCANDGCPMLAGSVVEIASAKHRDYGKGLQELLRLFQDRILRCPEFTPENFVTLITSQARLRRRLCQYVRKLQAPTDINGLRASVLAELQQSNIYDPGQHLIGVMLASEREPFMRLLEDLGLPEPQLPPDVPLLMLAYWEKSHALSAIVLTNPRGTWQTTIPFTNYRVAVAGLRMLSPTVQQVYLHDTAISAGIQNSRWRVSDPLTVSLTCLFGTGDNTVPDLPAVVAQHDHHSSTTMIARMQRVWPDLKVAEENEAPVGFDEFMFRVLKRHIRRSSLNSQGLVLLGSFNPQGWFKQALHGRLKSAGFVGAADQLARSLYSIEIARTDRTITLETPEGYGVRRAGGPLELFSNFIVRIDSNVTFGEKAALHHRASVLIGDVQQDMILPGRLLDAPRELQEHIQLLLASRKSLLVPMLRDPSAFRSVAFYLRGTLPRLPTQIGLPFLGWNFKRDTFFTPGAIVGMDGMIQDAFPLHPDVATLDAFSAEKHLDAAIDLALPREVQTFMLMILGSIIRGQRGERLQAVQVRHDGPAVALLEGLFRGLGQIRPVSRVERDAEGLRQYPVWATVGRVTGKINAPYFLLSDHGQIVREQHSEEVLGRAAETLRGLVRRVCETLLALSEPHQWQQQQSVLYTNGLVTCAQEFLHTRCGLELEADTPSFEWTEQLLQQIPQTAVSDIFSYDFKAQRVFCDAGEFQEDLDMISLELELRRLADNVVVHVGGKIELDAYSAFTLLEAYYGEPPQLSAVQ